MNRFIRHKVEIRNPDATMVCEHHTGHVRPSFDPAVNNVFLVGLRGSGKTTLGRMLAKRLGAAFVDTDQVVVRKAGISIAEIVATRGWAAFRSMESEALRDVSAQHGQVVATGGGIVLDPANRDLLEKSGVVIYLMADITTLAVRLAENPLAQQRPALSGLKLHQELSRCLLERGPLYMCLADHVLRVENEPEMLVRKLMEKIQ